MDEFPDEEKYLQFLDKTTYRNFVFVSWREHEPPKFDPAKMVRMMYAPERTQAGRFHWQGFVAWKSPHSTKSAYKALDKQMAVPAKGDFYSNLAYIQGPYDNGKGKTKPLNPDFVLHGEPPAPGGRDDLAQLKRKISDGDMSVVDVLNNDPHMFHLYERTLNRAEDERLKKVRRTDKTRMTWYECPNLGHLHDIEENPDAYEKGHGNWWDDYDLQETVEFHDFTADMIAKNELTALMGSASLRLPRRYRHPVPFMAKQVNIYCRRDPWDFFPDDVRSIMIHSPLFTYMIRDGDNWRPINKHAYYMLKTGNMPPDVFRIKMFE